MYELSVDQVVWVSGGSEATYSQGMADGEAAGRGVMQTAKVILVVAGIAALTAAFIVS